MNINWIYKKTKDNEARFVLGTKGSKTLICFGVNPSTATPKKLDPTLTRVRNFSKNLNYDSWIMLNIYPQRAIKPNNLDRKNNKKYHKENLKHIEQILKNNNHPESEIDKVTTPLGITITGLNKMEQEGFSSALIHGIQASYHKIKKLK